EYRYVSPVALPRGTVLRMRYTYDNSAENVSNPSHPPKPVRYGQQSSDEMAEFWLEVVPREPSARDALDRAYMAKLDRLFSERIEYLLRTNRSDADEQQQ